MRTAKTKTETKAKGTKLYSYDEFRKTFYPDSNFELPTPQDPRAFGRRLGEEAVKKIKEQAQARSHLK
jgi:hypothetical protein